MTCPSAADTALQLDFSGATIPLYEGDRREIKNNFKNVAYNSASTGCSVKPCWASQSSMTAHYKHNPNYYPNPNPPLSAMEHGYICGNDNADERAQAAQGILTLTLALARTSAPNLTPMASYQTCGEPSCLINAPVVTLVFNAGPSGAFAVDGSTGQA